MKVLVIGSGGREHAIAYKLNQSSKVDKIYAIPGNPGIAKIGECIEGSVEDNKMIVDFAKENKIDLTVIGPEVPLCNGLADDLEAAGLMAFGPTKHAATLEGSKAFSKDFMVRHNIPTAKYKEYTNLDEAISEIDSFGYPVVIKADGLAAGKGVVIPENREDAINTLKEMMSDKKFGSAGEKIVVEEFLSGIETSILAFVDNDTIVPMVSAKDHKKVYNFEKGPNTGGMGTFSPSEIYTDELSKEISEKVLNRTLQGFKKDNLNYKGVLFIGLMITEDGPKVLEYNVRFGDPETQSVLFRLETDLHKIMEAILDNKLKDIEINYKKEEAKDGSIFLDKDYDWTIPSSNLLMYGHNMGDGAMFQDLLKYEDEEFYKQHPIVRFTTATEDAEYEIISAFKSRVYYKSEKNVFRYYYFINADNEEEYNEFVNSAKEASFYDTGKTAEYGDQLMTLSTCSYHTEDGRFAVVARKK